MSASAISGYGSILLLLPILIFGTLGAFFIPRNRDRGLVCGMACGLIVDIGGFIFIHHAIRATINSDEVTADEDER